MFLLESYCETNYYFLYLQNKTQNLWRKDLKVVLMLHIIVHITLYGVLSTGEIY